MERCAALVHVLDCATLEVDREPVHDLDVIVAELAAYDVARAQVAAQAEALAAERRTSGPADPAA